MEAYLNGLDLQQVEYLNRLIDRDFERYGWEARMLSRELGQESPAYQRTEKKAEFVNNVGAVVRERLRYLRQVEEVQRRSAELKAV